MVHVIIRLLYKKELQQVAAYLSLEQARYPNRFNIHYRIDDQCQDALIPPFIIQILVENSIKHAFKNRKKNNHIDVDVSMKQDYLSISVQDNGQGIPADQLDTIDIRQ